MAERAAQVPYTPYATQESGGGGGTPMGVRATPEDFGSQIGGAVQKVSNEGQEIVQQQIGFYNETAANQAELESIKQSAPLSQKYHSLEGMAAFNAAPDYEKELMAQNAQIRATLSPMAQRMFDQTTARRTAFDIQNYYSYGAQQLKKANIDSYNSIADVAVNNAGNPAVASNDYEWGAQVTGPIKHAVASMMGTQGWGKYASTDPDTGKITFDDTPEGKQAQSTYQAELDKRLGPAYENKYKSLADINVESAYQKYQSERDKIPGEAQVKLDGMFTPKIRDYQARSVADNVMSSADQNYKTVSLATVNGPKPGTTDEAAINWTMQHEGGYVSNDSGKGPTNFGINQEANRDINVTALSQDQAKALIKERYFDKVTTPDMSPAMKMVAGDSAVNMGVQKTKDLLAQAGNDPQKLLDLRRQEYQRLATADPARYGASLSGWNKRLDDLQSAISATAQPAQNVAPRDFAAMPVNQASGITPQAPTPPTSVVPPMSKADYYRTNYQNIIDTARAQAQEQHPDDPSFADVAESRVKSRMSTAIQEQELKYKADNDTVYKALDGGYTNGERPTTIEQLVNSSPDVKAAWESVSINNPQAANLIETRLLGSNPMAKDSREYGPGYSALVNEAKNGTLTSDKLLQHLNVDIGRSGFDALQKLMGGTEEEKTYKSQNLKAVKAMLSGEDQFAGIKDPKGEALYAQALPIFDKEVDRLKGEGIPMAEIYNPQGKNWAGNAVRSLVRPPDQQMADMAASTTSAASSPEKPAVRDLAAIIQDVHNGKLTNEQGRAEALKLGFIKDVTGPQVPQAGGQ